VRKPARSGQAGRTLSTELANATPTSRLVAYLTAAIAVTVIGALVALALAFRAGEHGARRRSPAVRAPVPAFESESESESEIDIGDLTGGRPQR
jgi:hypothetical protein